MPSRADLDVLLTQWTLGDKLQRLALLSASDVRAIELIADDCLRHRWPTAAQHYLKIVRTTKLPRKSTA